MNYKSNFDQWLAKVSRSDGDFTCNLEVDFLPFATQGGANVQSQADYDANTKVLTGFTSGIALSPQLNKVWRQGAFFSAVLAQLIATVRNENVVDDGNLLGKIVQMWMTLLEVHFFVDGGVTNSVLLNNPTAPAGALTFEALATGVQVSILIAATNTGPATLDWMGIQTFPIIHQDGLPLTGGEMVAGSITQVVYRSGNWYLLNSALDLTVLGGDTQFFVNAFSGSDANNGLTSGTPWNTLQHAWNWVQSNVNLNGHKVTINCTGAFTAGVAAQGALLGASQGVSSFVWQFASGASVRVSLSNCLQASVGASFTVQSTGGNLDLEATGTGSNQGCGLAAYNGGVIDLNSGCVFGNCDFANIYAQGSGAFVEMSSNFTVSGTSGRFLFAISGGQISFTQGGFTVTSSGTTSYTLGVAIAQFGATITVTGTTFTGTVTGQRFNAGTNGVVETQSGDVNFIFGNVPGTVNLVAGVYGNGSGQYT